jgi:hypothetical protein
MPNIGELVGSVVTFLGEQIGASSLRLGPIPSVAVFGVVLVLLSLVARPTTRWMLRDLGHLAAVSRAMALAAEAGSDAVFSLGTAGVARGSAAFERLQTLAALPLLSHVARAAARAGVPLRVTSNDPVAVHLGEVALAEAHRRTDTAERAERSRVEFVGEGRATAAAAAMAEERRPAAAFVAGGISEESLPLLVSEMRDAEWTSFGTAQPSQAGSVLLTGVGALVGPELFQAPAELGPARGERTGALAANRLVVGALAVIVAGSAAAVASGIDLAAVLAGR